MRPLSAADSTGRCNTLTAARAEGVSQLKYRPRKYYTATQQALWWEYWKARWTLQEIGKLLMSHSPIHTLQSQRRRRLAAVLMMLGASICAAEPQLANKSNEAVADAGAAVKIALAAWIPRYGQAVIGKEAPYSAVVRGGIWFVKGTLPKGAIGGVAQAEISEADGRVLRVSHEQ